MRWSICILFVLLWNCKSVKEFRPEAIYGEWKLVSWINAEAIDLDADGVSSVDLLAQFDCCYKESILHIEKDAYDKIIYIGVDKNPLCFKGHSGNKERMLPSISFYKKEQALAFHHKYFVDKYKIIELNDRELIIEGNPYYYVCDNSNSYRGGRLKFVKYEKE